MSVITWIGIAVISVVVLVWLVGLGADAILRSRQRRAVGWASRRERLEWERQRTERAEYHRQIKGP